MKLSSLSLILAAVAHAPVWAQRLNDGKMISNNDRSLKKSKNNGARKCLSRDGDNILTSKTKKNSKTNKNAKSNKDTFNCADISSSLVKIAMLQGSAFKGNVLEIGDAGYDTARLQYASPSHVTSPSFIVEALNEIDVQATVMFAARCEYPLTTRSGGHNYIGMSSCDSSEGTCIQLDVGGLNKMEITALPSNQGKHVTVGPGVMLRDLFTLFNREQIFVPAGECDAVSIGGHMQTGGVGVWMRQFGYLSHHVNAFKIVLADGSLVSVTKPNAKTTTTKFNDDLFFAVVGGASGSFGTIVEITLDTHDERDYYSVYWEVNFLWSDETLPGIKKMLRMSAQLLEDPNTSNDRRWGLFWTAIGYKNMLQLNDKWPGPAFNFISIDFSWAVPRTPSLVESEELAAAQSIYDSIVKECPGCLLDDFLPPPLRTNFLSTYADTRPLSQLSKDVQQFDWSAQGFNGIKFQTSAQFGRHNPSPNDIEAIISELDDFMPKNKTDMRALILQTAVMAGSTFADSSIALPFPDNDFLLVLDVWDLTGQVDYSQQLRAFQDKVIAATGGEDRRMFWGAYEDPCLECGDWKQYYESKAKYDKLKKIKTCVDPNYVFKSRLSISPHDEL